MTPYERGRAFEYRVMKYYEARGYFVVRSAGSHSPVDLVALKYHAPATDVVLIQCKAGKARLAKADRIGLVRLAKQIRALAIIATRDPRNHLVLDDAEQTVPLSGVGKR